MRQVYLDWAATAPLCEEAAEAMRPYLEPGMANIAYNANANSLHTPGRTAFCALEKARACVARCVGARRADEITFTSGATEADNAALFGIVEACARNARLQGRKGFVPHVVTTGFEHDAVLMAARELKARGCEVTVVNPRRDGFVDESDVRAALCESTVLVSVMAANNEIGTIQPV